MIERLSWTSLLALALLGCDPAPSATKEKHAFDSNGGHYTVELVTTPSPIQVNQPFDVDVRVMPKSGGAADLGVQVDARMPAHFHGMPRMAKVTRGKGDTWKAEGLLFHMSGLWELYVDITRGGTTERAQMDVELK